MKNQKGFSVVVVILALLLIVAVGFTGYYVWNSQQSKMTVSGNQSKIDPAVTTQKTTEIPTQNTDTRNTYTSKVLGLTMKLPEGWTASELSDGSGMVTIKSKNYTEKETGIGSMEPVSGVKVEVTSQPSNGKPVAENDTVKTTIGYGDGDVNKKKINGNEAIEYTWAYESKPVTTTAFIIGDKVVIAKYISVDNSHNNDSYSAYQQILETIN